MKTKITFLFLLSALLLMNSCHRVRPQGPANQTREDSAALALVELNFRLADENDHILVDSVKQTGKDFVLSDMGFWYRRLTATTDSLVKRQDEVDFEARVYNLADGSLIEDMAASTKVTSGEVIRAIDYCLPLMRVGEEFELYAPYYSAYGRDGSDGVEPLTNVKIYLKVIDIR